MEIELVSKIAISLVVFNLTIIMFSLLAVGSLPINSPTLEQFSGIQRSLNVSSSNLASGFSVNLIETTDTGIVGGVIGIANILYKVLLSLFNIVSLMIIGVSAIVILLFVIVPGMLNLTFSDSSFGYIFTVIYSVINLVIAIYAFALLIRLITKVFR